MLLHSQIDQSTTWAPSLGILEQFWRDSWTLFGIIRARKCVQSRKPISRSRLMAFPSCFRCFMNSLSSIDWSHHRHLHRHRHRHHFGRSKTGHPVVILLLFFALLMASSSTMTSSTANRYVLLSISSIDRIDHALRSHRLPLSGSFRDQSNWTWPRRMRRII